MMPELCCAMYVVDTRTIIIIRVQLNLQDLQKIYIELDAPRITRQEEENEALPFIYRLKELLCIVKAMMIMTNHVQFPSTDVFPTHLSSRV